MTPEERRQIWEERDLIADRLFNDGASILEVARTLDVHPSTAQRRYHGRGWTHVESGRYRAMRMWGPKVEGLT